MAYGNFGFSAVFGAHDGCHPYCNEGVGHVVRCSKNGFNIRLSSQNLGGGSRGHEVESGRKDCYEDSETSQEPKGRCHMQPGLLGSKIRTLSGAQGLAPGSILFSSMSLPLTSPSLSVALILHSLSLDIPASLCVSVLSSPLCCL